MGWKELTAEKRDRIKASIPKEWLINAEDPVFQGNSVMDAPAKSGILMPEELEITEFSATDLVDQMAQGKLSSVAVTTAFCKRAALATQLLNCTLEFFPDKALARAKELDDYYMNHGKTVGPLHGLPISLKDQFRIKDLETTMGYVAWIGKYETDESYLVTILSQAGAVLYVKTSVPQTLLMCETVNNIVGRTVNPRNKNWSCGGSSGGEGAMIGFRGAIMGVGTDIGGSIRVPSAFNFLYGLKPSHGRFPYGKMASCMEGQETVHGVCGPLCHSIPDMRLLVKSILGGEPWKFDSKVIQLPWRQSEEDAIKAKVSLGELTLGFFNCDGVVLPHPPILRGIETVVSTCQNHGISVVPWKPYKHDFAVELIMGIYGVDGGTDVYGVINESGEPPVPNWQALFNPDVPKVDMNKLWDLQLEKWKYQCDYLEQWRLMEKELGKELDAIIAPITPTAAVLHDQFKYYGYAAAINLLDFTSVVVPVTFANKDIDKKKEAYEPLNEMDKTVQADYDPEAYHGAPVAVQIFGRRLSEERVMAIAEEVGRLLGNEVTP